MADVTQTDVSRPSALPTAKLRPTGATQQPSIDQNSSEYLDLVEEEWNKKVDIEVETLVEGMTDIVALASIGDKDKFQIAQEAFVADCRAESMVKAAQSLLSITHSLKLILFLSDEAQIVAQRDKELKKIRTETEQYKRRAAELIDELVKMKYSADDDDIDDTMDFDVASGV